MTAGVSARVQLLPDTLVSLRRHRWRVVTVRAFDGCALVTLRGVCAPLTGVIRRVLTPFDRLEPIERHARPKTVGVRRWRRACRAAIAADAPPGGLRSALHARIDLMPYQLEPALAIVRGCGCRVLLADEVGLGKTIQAGLIVSELRARGIADRVLVVTPAGLRDQWRGELRDRFAITCQLADARSVREAAVTLPPDVDPWTTFEVAVTSIDYVKRADVMAAAARRPWDIVVVDEAHAAASDSDRRAAVEALAASATFVLLLTATPHNGNRDAFASLCGLGCVADDPLIVFRRTRHDAGVALRRRVRTLHVRPTAHERRLHAALRRYGDAVIAERPHAWLALSVLHKRALSSAAALAESIEHRLRQLDAIEPTSDALQLDLPLDAAGETTTDDEAPRWAAELALSNADRERRLLAALVHTARVAARRESKIAALARLLTRVRDSVLVFTEYRDTLAHLLRALDRPAIVLHGGLTRDERAAAVDTFTRSPGAVLLATDAAGEGLNLHAACRLVVNLELPWNPMRLEQRIGRVDRIGQRRTVHAIHLVARGTGETALLTRLHARLAEARSAIGAPDPFGANDERAAAEIIVLRRTPARSTIEPPPPLRVTSWGELVDAGREEAARVAELRRLLPVDVGSEPARPWLIHARPALRRHLQGRRLELWRARADDGNGRRVESRLVALVVDRGGDATEVAIDRVCREWRAAAAHYSAALAEARRRRNDAICSDDDRVAAAIDQLPLFSDRRRLREQMIAAAERTARRAEFDRRAADSRAAATLAFRPPELLLVVVP